MALLEGEKVTKFFGGLAAVTVVDFSVEPGEVIGLIGPNGAGKTTLFNLISATFPPTSGIIRLKGQKTSHLKPHQLCRRGVSRTFQNVKVFANVSALENVVLGAYFGTSGQVASGQAYDEASGLLDFVGLSDFKDTPAKDLTLSSQKRLEVARALATKPDLLLLDEIMVGLTPVEVSGAMDLIRSIRDRGVTVVMIEHIMKAIMNLCGRIIVLHHGEKIAEGTPKEIASSETVMKVYLGDRAHAVY
jgi:branched-chain amino acid transport system ATP-binding protein